VFLDLGLGRFGHGSGFGERGGERLDNGIER
jgi:hypothetical protein